MKTKFVKFNKIN